MDGIVKLELPEEKSFPCRSDDTGVTDKQKKLPYLRLKNNNKRDEPHTDKLPQDLTEQLHLESFNDLPDNVKRDDPYEDPYGGCPFYEVVHLIKQHRKKDDVDDVDDPDVEQSGYT